MGSRLGQHFLHNVEFARELVKAAGVQKGDRVLEIGPGHGFLTHQLLKAGAHVVAVEKDEELAVKLHAECASAIASGMLTIITDDIRNFKPEEHGLKDNEYILAANIPYYITGEIIRTFLEAQVQPKTIAILIQKEVAERIVSDQESILSISVKAYGIPRYVATVGKSNFTPPPKVDSAILAINNISRTKLGNIDGEHFFKVVRAGFASKRKVLSNNLGVVFEKEKALSILRDCGLKDTVRAQEVPLETWIKIAALLS